MTTDCYDFFKNMENTFNPTIFVLLLDIQYSLVMRPVSINHNFNSNYYSSLARMTLYHMFVSSSLLKKENNIMEKVFRNHLYIHVQVLVNHICQ